MCKTREWNLEFGEKKRGFFFCENRRFFLFFFEIETIEDGNEKFGPMVWVFDGVEGG